MEHDSSPRGRLERLQRARQLGAAWIEIEAQVPELVHALRLDGASWDRIAALLGGIRTGETFRRKYGEPESVPALHTPGRNGGRRRP